MRLPIALTERAQVARFLGVGIVATATYVVLAWLGAEMVALPAAAVSLGAYFVASAISYLGHRAITFRLARPHLEALPRFLGVTIAGNVLAFVIPMVLTDLLGLAIAISIAVTCVSVPVFTYFSLSRLVFRSA